MSRFAWDGQIKLARNFTDDTARTICEICLWLRKNGYTYATEVKMKFGQRADICVPELLGSQVLEIMDSETVYSIESKRVVYEKHGIDMLAVPASDHKQAIRMIIEANGLKGKSI
jgi:hypothetical protein